VIFYTTMSLNLRARFFIATIVPAIVLVGATIGATSAQAAQLVAAPADDIAFNQLISSGQFAEKFVTSGRIGNNNATNGDYEMGILRPNQTVAASTQNAWSKGTPMLFSLEYDGTTVKYTVGNKVISSTEFTGNATDLFMRTRTTKDSSVTLSNLSFTDTAGTMSVANISSAGDGTNGDLDYLRLGKIKGAFTLTGTSTMNWTGTTAPRGSSLIYQFKVGNSTSVPEPATVGALTIVAGAIAARRRNRSA
jgi:hypothetical protein